MIRQACLTLLTAYSEKGKTPALDGSASARQICIFNMRAQNRSGSTIDVGLMRRLASNNFKIYTKVLSVYTDVTSSVSGGVQVVNATNDDDGFVVAADRRFGLVGITVSNSATGGTYAFKYWNGSSYTTLTTLQNPTSLGTTQDEYIAFIPPVDWVAGGPTGVSSSLYSILVQHTTKPADTGSINALWVGEFLDFYEGVADNNSVQLIFDSDRPFILDAGESLIPYFSTASATNLFAAFYATV